MVFRAPDPEMLDESASARHSFQRLRQLNTVVFALLGVMVLLGIWCVVTLIRQESANAPDLATISPIQDHISSRLINVVGVITLLIFIYKEWRYGERSFGMVYFLLPLLAVWLIPVMAAESQAPTDTKEVEFTLNLCEPGGIEGTSVIDNRLCGQQALADGDVYLSLANPTDDDPELLEPMEILSDRARWQVTGSGEYTVYFLLRQESLDACTTARFVTGQRSGEQISAFCLERDGVAYSVHPFVTSREATGRLVVYQELEAEN